MASVIALRNYKPRSLSRCLTGASQQTSAANVRFGSKADMEASPQHVRFTPESGHRTGARYIRCSNSGSLAIFAAIRTPDKAAVLLNAAIECGSKRSRAFAARFFAPQIPLVSARGARRVNFLGRYPTLPRLPRGHTGEPRPMSQNRRENVRLFYISSDTHEALALA